jgi:hypothetical protein
MRAAVRRASTLILRAEDELREAGAVIANAYLRLDHEEWIRVLEKRRAALQGPQWRQARSREPPRLRCCWSSRAPDGLRSRDLRLDRAVRTAGLLYGRVCYSIVCPQRDSNPCRRLERAKS